MAPPETGPLFRVVAGGGATDTIQARLLQALIVEIRDSTGQLATGKTIRFEALPADDPDRRNQPTILVKALDGIGYATFGVDVTDSLGRAQMLIALGSVAGQARLSVHIPEFGSVDTVTYTVLPGRSARLIIGTRDTTVQPGATYSLNASLVDRFTNLTPGESPTYSAGPGIASVSAGGLVTVGSTPVQGRVLLNWQALSDTARVTVFERLPLVGARAGLGVLLVNTDGTGFRMIATSTHASFSPHGVKSTNDVVYYQGGPFADASIWIVTPGTSPRLLAGPANGFHYAAWARWSPDGRWVYFLGARSFLGQQYLWRVAPDGTQLDSVYRVNSATIYIAPSIAPDGATAAVFDDLGLQLIDVATKSARLLNVSCGNPRYSPDGRRLACLRGGRLSIVNADGTGATALSSPDEFFDLGGVDWSPDGNWLIAHNTTAGPQLVNVNGGAVLPLRTLGTGTYQLSFVR